MSQTTPKGIQYPEYSDAIKYSGSESALADDLRELAQSADSAIANGVAEAISDAEGKYGGLPARVTAVETKNTAQDERLDDLEELQPAKAVRLEGGKWVWDPGGTPTHYVLIAHDGKPTVRATPWPTPNPTTPELTW